MFGPPAAHRTATHPPDEAAAAGLAVRFLFCLPDIIFILKCPRQRQRRRLLARVQLFLGQPSFLRCLLQRKKLVRVFHFFGQMILETLSNISNIFLLTLELTQYIYKAIEEIARYYIRCNIFF